MTWLRRHFRRYWRREPWDFCWRIAIEGTLVSLAAALVVSILGAEGRKLEINFPALLCIGVIVAPVLETLLFQALPVCLARLCKASFAQQVVASVVPFFLAHAVEGLATGVAAGLVGGFYFAFSYARWCRKSAWTAFWVTAASHAIHNGILIPLAFAL
jgi:hypothetical protein